MPVGTHICLMKMVSYIRFTWLRMRMRYRTHHTKKSKLRAMSIVLGGDSNNESLKLVELAASSSSAQATKPREIGTYSRLDMNCRISTQVWSRVSSQTIAQPFNKRTLSWQRSLICTDHRIYYRLTQGRIDLMDSRPLIGWRTLHSRPTRNFQPSRALSSSRP